MHLQNNPLTMPDAVLNYNIYRLASIVHSLKKDGHNIVSEDIKFTNRFGHQSSYSKYKLIEKTNGN